MSAPEAVRDLVRDRLVELDLKLDKTKPAYEEYTKAYAEKEELNRWLVNDFNGTF